MNRDTFTQLVHRILNEEVEKKSSTDQIIYKRLPEVVHGEDLKKITPHEKDTKSKDELLDDITKVVHEIDSMFTVIWDDHDDISISGRDLIRIRIIPRWENNYNIETFIRNEDRIYITGQTWDQVKQFVKNNLKKKTETYTDKAFTKNDKNREDKDKTSDKNLPQKDKPKTLPLTDKPLKDTKSKDKNYTEKPKDNDDLPEKPMKEVGEFKKLTSYKVQDPVKLRKRPPDTKLTIKQS